MNAEYTVQVIAWLLVAATIVGVVARRLQVPYVIALVVLGLVLGAARIVPTPQLDPSLMLFVLLPPLLFDAAFRLDTAELRGAWRAVLVLAGPGVVLAALVVGVVAHLALGLPLISGLLLGSIVAATDPVAVTAIFRRLHVPKHTEVIVEAESLFNDGVAITLYIVFLGLAVNGATDPLGAAETLAREIVVGLAVGLVLGLAASRLTRLVDEPLVEMTLSTALAYGSYLVAQGLDSSGALACVAAGMVHGSYGRETGMSPRTREHLDLLWEYLGFVANSFVFLLVGFTVNAPRLLAEIGSILVAVVAILVARIASTVVAARVVPRRLLTIRPPEQAVLVWGGLRGGLTVALALALPRNLPDRGLIEGIAFGVAIFTLIVQGLTLPLAIRWLQLGKS